MPFIRKEGPCRDGPSSGDGEGCSGTLISVCYWVSRVAEILMSRIGLCAGENLAGDVLAFEPPADHLLRLVTSRTSRPKDGFVDKDRTIEVCLSIAHSHHHMNSQDTRIRVFDVADV